MILPGLNINMGALLAVGAAVLIGALWLADRSGQYQRGVADTKLAVERAIAGSKELIDDEKDAARDAASDAARRVCVDAGADPRDCGDL